MSEDKIFDWDSEIENDGGEYPIAPAGDYDFTVTSVERGWHDAKPGGKLPSCNMATLTCRVEASGKQVNIFHRLFLCEKQEWLLCQFFTAIGQRQSGQKLKMDWGRVVGSRGRCKVIEDEYNGKAKNEIKTFYAPKPGSTSQESNGGW